MTCERIEKAARRIKNERMSADLFGNAAPAIPGLGIKADAITVQEERDLIAGIEEIDLPRFQFQAWLSKRRTRSFGCLYDFRNASFGPSEPIPEFLQPLQAAAAEFAGVPNENIVQVSVIHYEIGAGIGWHVDRPELDAVIGISPGTEATMRFRRRKARRVRASVRRASATIDLSSRRRSALCVGA